MLLLSAFFIVSAFCMLFSLFKDTVFKTLHFFKKRVLKTKMAFYDTRLKTPFNCIISGASKSGKTTFVNNLLTLSNEIFTKKPDRIILFYKYMQDIYSEMQENNLVDEMIDINDGDFNIDMIVDKVSRYKNGNGSMIILDDSMTDMGNNFEQIFTNVSHHQNCSVIFITQNLFYKDKIYRTMSLNAHYFILMKNERDKQQIKTLASQFCPGNSTYVIQAFNDATKTPFSYLMLDFTQDSPACLKLRTNIFPTQFPYTIYLEK